MLSEPSLSWLAGIELGSTFPGFCAAQLQCYAAHVHCCAAHMQCCAAHLQVKLKIKPAKLELELRLSLAKLESIATEHNKNVQIS